MVSAGPSIIKGPGLLHAIFPQVIVWQAGCRCFHHENSMSCEGSMTERWCACGTCQL